MNAYKEYIRDPWRLRVLHCPQVNVQGDERFPTGTMDIWLFFVAFDKLDEWMPWGVTNFEPTAETIDDFYESLDGEEQEQLDVATAYMGVPWSDTEIEPHIIAGALTTGWKKMDRQMKDRLMKLSRSEIEALRRAEEAQHGGSLN